MILEIIYSKLGTCVHKATIIQCGFVRGKCKATAPTGPLWGTSNQSCLQTTERAAPNLDAPFPLGLRCATKIRKKITARTELNKILNNSC